ncbi:hypothetical protein O181_079299 [Austropuccinia psidii MF-1]|uniref:Reverse transcriptase Ty1/copia-type domain-containing protein n=1 Tax=Austropuccinia psidii MF-1 TaxID=1389203 RepID=A0A9Q3FIM0_9BASI|nr:hypothetical protein [Austropuccinia psidii MF-1]
MPPSLWTFAFKHAAWIFNRVLHVEEQKTPYKIMTGKKPSFHLLRVFGAKSYIHNYLHRKDMNVRAIVGCHLGITPESKAWSFWIPGHDKVVQSASVKFDETTFFPGPPKPGAILSTIQVTNITDDSMVKEINRQDAMTTSMNSSHDINSIIPTSYKEALQSKEAEDWKKAIVEEIKSMKDEHVFKTIPLSQVLKSTKREDTLSMRWVFVKKPAPLRFKARLVAQGFRQVQGINFDKTFAPTPTFAALRLLLVISCKHRWPLKTFDVKVAFLHSYIDMPVYLWPLKGLETGKCDVLQLNKSLYGTKQAARCWWMHLTVILKDIGFIAIEEDPSSYSYNGTLGKALLWIHVDDGALTASSNELLSHIKLLLNSKLNIKWDDNISSLVGITISCVNGGYFLSQRDLIDKVVGMANNVTTTTSPLPHNCNLISNPTLTMDIAYLQRIASTGTWISPECKGNAFECYVDANWGGEGNRSTHVFLMLYHGSPVSWQSKRQPTVAGSTCQAEYIALSFAAKECTWLSNLFLEITGPHTPKILSDNKAAINISSNVASRNQTRHLLREFNYINELLCKGSVTIGWISTKHQLADILTKALGGLNVQKYIDFIYKGCICGGECNET